MTRTAMALVAATLTFAPGLHAQDPEAPRPVRRVVEDAFALRLQRQLGLDSARAAAVGKVLTASGATRRALEAEERELNAQLARQLRPGIAADEGAVTSLIDRILANRVAFAQSFRDEMRELTPLLTPVQRAQYLRLRDDVMRSVRVLQERRGEGRPDAERPMGRPLQIRRP